MKYFTHLLDKKMPTIWPTTLIGPIQVTDRKNNWLKLYDLLEYLFVACCLLFITSTIKAGALTPIWNGGESG